MGLEWYLELCPDVSLGLDLGLSLGLGLGLVLSLGLGLGLGIDSRPLKNFASRNRLASQKVANI